MKKYILLALCAFAQCASATYTDALQLERELVAQEEVYRTRLAKRYPSVINYLYRLSKEAFRDIKQGLWDASEAFADLLRPWHPYKEEIAYVRYAPKDQICADERQYIKNRIPKVREALNTLLDEELQDHELPRIGLCFSGGGFRSMTLTLGFLQGAVEMGLYDATMFMCGLSGSTWAMAPWIASQEPLDVYIDGLTKKIEHGIDHINNPNEIRLFMQQLMCKVMYKQPISAMDIYGAMLANTLLEDLGNSRISATLTETHKDVIKGEVPLPIYTSIKTNSSPYEWMECTPFEIGSEYLQSYIPTWAYGRKFKHGASRNHAPEQSLGYFLGIFGSAFEVSFKDILFHTQDQLLLMKNKLPKILQYTAEKLVHVISNSPLNDFRLFPSMLRNYTHNIQWSPICDDKHICLVDAGIDFNVPFPPLLRPERKLDIIIVYDSSGVIEGAPELKRAAAYAWRKRLKFPEIDYDTVDKNTVSVFKDEDPETPIVIYFPRIKNPEYSDFDPEYCLEESYCGSTNFQYSREQFAQLSGLALFTVRQHRELILAQIKDAVKRKRVTS